MAELSPARETASPAPRPADETTPLITTSTAATADDGNTPLLATSTSTGQTTPANFAFASTAVKTLTILTLTFSAATLVFMGVTVLICQFVPARHYLPYLVSDAFPALTFWSIISICISSFNIARQRSNRISAPLIINLLFDIIISFNIVDFSLQGLLAFGYPYNMCPWPEDDRPACMKQGLPIRVFAALALGTALSTGVCFLALFVIRCVALYRTHFWRRPMRLPVGQLTLEFTIKLLREPQGEPTAAV